MKMPKLKHYHSTFESSSIICCKDSGYLTEHQAAEAIRRIEAYEGLVGALQEIKALFANCWMPTEVCAFKVAEQALDGEKE